MKRLISVLLIVLLIITLSGCENRDTEVVSSRETSSVIIKTVLTDNEAMSYDYTLYTYTEKWKNEVTNDDVIFLKSFIDTVNNFDLTGCDETKHFNNVNLIFTDMYNACLGKFNQEEFDKHFDDYSKSYKKLSKLSKNGFTKYTKKQLNKIKDNFENIK